MDLAHLIDHTLLKPYCTLAEVKEICNQAIEYQFAAVCIPPYYVKDASHLLNGANIKVATVVGFPMGYATTAAKVEEIKRAIDEGADELDAVVNLCAAKNGTWNYIKNELESLTTACHMMGKVLKAIIETGALDKSELLKLAELCVSAEVDYVKTSTGFNAPGASLEAVTLLRSVLPKEIKIKASGGIKDRHFAEQLVQAGANRIGTSSGIQIIKG